MVHLSIAVRALVGALLVSPVEGQVAPEPPLPDGVVRRLGSLILVHEDINGVAFTNGGTCLVTSGFDGRVKVWDTRTGEWLGDYAPAGDPIYGVGLSASRDGAVLAFSRFEYIGGVEPPKHPELWRDGVRLPCPAEGGGIVVSPDGRLAATWSGNDREVTVFKVGSGDFAARRVIDGDPSRVEFSDDSSRVHVRYHELGPSKERVYRTMVLDAADLRFVSEGDPVSRTRSVVVDNDRTVDFTSDARLRGGSLSLNATEDGEVREIWRVEFSQHVRNVAVSSKVGLVALAGPGDDVTLLDLDDGVKQFDAPTGRVVFRLHTKHVAASHVSDLVVALTRLEGESSYVWNAATGERVAAFNAGVEPAYVVFVSPRSFVTMDRQGPLVLWKVAETGEVTRCDEEALVGVVDIAPSHEGGVFATLSNEVRLWTVRDDALHQLAGIPTEGFARSAALSRDGQLMALRSKDLEIVTLPGLQRVAVSSVSARHRAPLVFLHDKSAVVISDKRGLRWINPMTGDELRAIDDGLVSRFPMALSENGRHLAVIGWGAGSVKVYDTSTGELVREHAPSGEEIRGVTWWNGHLMTAMSSGTLLIWEP